MNFDESVLRAIKQQAKRNYPAESCGVVIEVNGKQSYYPCRNDYLGNQEDMFILSAEDYAKAEDIGKIIAIAHSHTVYHHRPSIADLVGVERTQLPWIIYSNHTDEFSFNTPNGFTLPILGRQYIATLVDCYTLIQDIYKQELNITLKEYDRPDFWWKLPEYNFYEDHYKENDFIEVELDDLKKYDLVLMRLISSKINHGAVYMGDNIIYQHCADRLSTADVYGGFWQKITAKVLRHRSQL